MLKKGFLALSVLTTLFVLALVGYSIHRSTSSTSLEMSTDATFTGLRTVNAPTHNIVVVHGIGTHCIGYADTLINRTANLLGVHLQHNADDKFSIDGHLWDQYCSESRDGKRQMGLDDSVEKQGRKCNNIYWTRRGNAANTEDCYVLYVSNSEFRSGAQVSSEAQTDNAAGDPTSQYITGFVRIRELSLDDERKVRFFEITWSPASRWVKKSLQGVQTFNKTKSRAEINVNIKEGLVDSAIADAVAYLGKSGVLVNHDLLQAFCLITAIGSASPGEDPLPSRYSCTSDHLKNARRFAHNNAVSFISHSLGTRVLMDTLGLLSFGVEGGSQQPVGAVKAVVTEVKRSVDIIDAKLSRSLGPPQIGKAHRESVEALQHLVNELKCYVEVGAENTGLPDTAQCEKRSTQVSNRLALEMERRFSAIGAQAGDPTFLHQLAMKEDPGSESPLSQGIRAFIESIESIYIFTNQIPLLYSHIGSPFFDIDSNFSDGLSGFLKTRSDARQRGVLNRPLQIVSFHDPDDLLSYNLKCWFHSAILKGDEEVKDILWNQAENDVKERMRSGKIDSRCESVETTEQLMACMTGYEAYRIRQKMFSESCFEDDFREASKNRPESDPDWHDLYLRFWDTQQDIALIDVNVLMSARGGPAFVWPKDVHSNYFSDDAVMRYLVCGSGGCNDNHL